MTTALDTTLASAYLRRHPDEAARDLSSLSTSEIARVVLALPAEDSAKVIRRLNVDDAAHVLQAAEDDLGTSIISALEPMRAAGLLARLDPPERTRRLELLPEGARGELLEMLDFPPGTAGSLMDPRVTLFRPDETVETALSRLRSLRGRRVADLVIVDTNDHLLGLLPLQELIAGDPDAAVSSLSLREPVSVTPMAQQEEVAELLNLHKLASLPVVDLGGRVIGVLRYDALVRAARQEAIADVQKMVGAGAEERALAPPWFAVKNRLPWLQINLATAFLAASVVGFFDATIERFTALAVLLPVVAGQSGNTGAQALAVTMRGLALREIRTRQWLPVLRKELTAGLINGVAVSAVTSAGVMLWSRNSGLTLVIGIAMIVSMFAAAGAGVAIPMILTSLRKDPATASSIILTTVTDVVGFSTFLGLATLLSGLIAGT